MDDWFDWFQLFGSVASILGAGISCYVLYELRQVRKGFLLRARLPELRTALEQAALKISAAISDLEQNPEVAEETFLRCEAVLGNLRPKVKGESRQLTRGLIETLSRRSKPLTKNQVRRIYVELQRLIESLKQVEEDSRWST